MELLLQGPGVCRELPQPRLGRRHVDFLLLPTGTGGQEEGRRGPLARPDRRASSPPRRPRPHPDYPRPQKTKHMVAAAKVPRDPRIPDRTRCPARHLHRASAIYSESTLEYSPSEERPSRWSRCDRSGMRRHFRQGRGLPMPVCKPAPRASVRNRRASPIPSIPARTYLQHIGKDVTSVFFCIPSP